MKVLPFSAVDDDPFPMTEASIAAAKADAAAERAELRINHGVIVDELTGRARLDRNFLDDLEASGNGMIDLIDAIGAAHWTFARWGQYIKSPAQRRAYAQAAELIVRYVDEPCRVTALHQAEGFAWERYQRHLKLLLELTPNIEEQAHAMQKFADEIVQTYLWHLHTATGLSPAESAHRREVYGVTELDIADVAEGAEEV